MKRRTNVLLLLAAAGSITISLIHIAIPFLGSQAYGYFGAADLVPSAERGSLLPALLTWALALAFAIFGMYALSGTHIIGGLPLLRAGLLAIASIYILRGLALFPEAAQLLRGTLHPPRRAVFSAASLLMGLLYAGGLVILRRTRSPGSIPGD